MDVMVRGLGRVMVQVLVRVARLCVFAFMMVDLMEGCLRWGRM